MQKESLVTKPFQVIDVQLLAADVYRVQLGCDQGYVPQYYAGQYLEILLGDSDALAFSIASAPSNNQKSLELHIQKLSGRESSEKLFDQLNTGSVIVRMAKGRCYVNQITNRPLLLIAAGTGFAQMKSIVEYCLNKQHHGDIHLYWGAKKPSNFYLPSLPIHWSEKKLIYHPVVSDISSESDWCGRFGLLYEAVLADKEKITEAEIYISGSPNMVYTTMDLIVDHGFDQSRVHSDVFEYAPRNN
ncbi:MAG: NAD(P)H-flavin reductase [Endozoicomonas sp. (ex Botrylloides leachii)]|nr:NAD(P)H-flavin reductase [Endozoicomonas sp. (ex Botrylloides leachii)]